MGENGIFRKAMRYLHDQSRIIEVNAVEVGRSNERLAYAMLTMACLCYLPLFIMTFFVEDRRSLADTYLIVLLVLGAYLVAFQKLKRSCSPTYLIYGGYALYLAYSLWSSAFVSPDYACASILLILVQMPIVMLDKSWRVIAVELVFLAMYLAVAVPFKNPSLVLDEVTNCIIFAAFGVGIGEALRYGRLANAELKRQALQREKTDALTGLGNRKSFFEHLKKLEADEDSYADIGFLMIDIDYFKQYNDTYGHQKGDDCLQKVGACLRAFGKKHAVEFYRYGGEEFVGLAVGYEPDELLYLCSRLNAAVIALSIPHPSPTGDVVTVSIGFSTATGTSAAARQHGFLAQADVALYAAKARGRNCSVRYAEGMSMEGAAGAHAGAPSFRTER